MCDIFFVNTMYQFEVSLDVIKHEGLESCIYIVPIELYCELSKYISSGFSFVCIEELNENMGFLKSRKLLVQMKSKVKRFYNKKCRIWLANDDHILGQFLLNYLKVDSIFLFEDGMGSYIKHKFMMHDYGLKVVLSKVKKILFFFPYYRSLYRFGVEIRPVKCYSYNKSSFPMLKTQERVLLIRESRGFLLRNKLISNNSVIIIGQPLVEAGIVSKERYCDALNIILREFFTDRFVLYKPHPRETDFSKVPEAVSVILSNNLSAENEIVTGGSSISLCGFYSTVLLNSNAIRNVDEVIAIKLPEIRKVEEIYEVLQGVGCTVVVV